MSFYEHFRNFQENWYHMSSCFATRSCALSLWIIWNCFSWMFSWYWSWNADGKRFGLKKNFEFKNYNGFLHNDVFSQVLGSVITGSRHNAIQSISPATSKMLLKTVIIFYSLIWILKNWHFFPLLNGFSGQRFWGYKSRIT